MSDILVDELADDLWLQALGPAPEGDFTGYDAGEPSSWPEVDDGPYSGVFWFRWVETRLRMNPTIEGAKALRAHMRRGLQTGELLAIAVNRDGRAPFEIPPDKWLASDEGGRWRWWSGLFWTGPDAEDRCDVYLVGEPGLGASPMKTDPEELHPRRRNTLMKVIYGMTLAYYGSDYPALPTVIHRDLEAKGVHVSDDTIRDILAEARELYDPTADTDRKRGKAQKPN